MSALGSNVEVGNLKAIAAANQFCAANGMDSISAGVTIAWAIECFEKGLLTKADTGGLELHFGDEQVVMRLLEMIVGAPGSRRRPG